MKPQEKEKKHVDKEVIEGLFTSKMNSRSF